RGSRNSGRRRSRSPRSAASSTSGGCSRSASKRHENLHERAGSRMMGHRSWLFEGLPLQALQRELDRLERRSFPAGAMVMAEGSAPGEMLVILSGHAVVYSERYGELRHISRVGPWAPLGEMSLLTGQAVSANVKATTA